MDRLRELRRRVADLLAALARAVRLQPEPAPEPVLVPVRVRSGWSPEPRDPRRG